MNLKPVLFLLSPLVLGACAAPASLTVHSQPEGAMLVQPGTGKVLGVAPLVAHYDPKALAAGRNADGCTKVQGFEARWPSGATSQLAAVLLCGADHGDYSITVIRDASEPGLEQDQRHAQALRTLAEVRAKARAVESDQHTAGHLVAINNRPVPALRINP